MRTGGIDMQSHERNRCHVPNTATRSSSTATTNGSSPTPPRHATLCTTCHRNAAPRASDGPWCICGASSSRRGPHVMMVARPLQQGHKAPHAAATRAEGWDSKVF